MSTTVVLAMPADRSAAARIADALLAARLDVRLVSFDHTVVAEAVATARCAIFCWSAAAQEPAAAEYRALAARLSTDHRAIGVAIERGYGPPSDAQMTTCSLSERQLTPGPVARWVFGDLYMRDVIAAATSKAAGIDPPSPSAASRILRRQAWAILVAVGALWGSFTGLEAINKRIPWPRYAETAAWKAIKPGSCDDLRAFLLKFPDGTNASKARTVLAAPTATTTENKVERRFPVGDTLGVAPPAGSEAAARKAAELRLAGEATRLCANYAQTAGARLTKSRIGESQFACQQSSGGWSCQIEGQAVCSVAEAIAKPTCPVSD